jgi:serine/threonine protein kinase
MINHHPNIVIFFVVKEKYILMEELKQLNTEDLSRNINEVIESMKKAKDFLQSLGIIYIDWKFDNIGKNKENVYKLFDFDASGIIDLNTNEWIIEPPNFFSYRNSKERKCKTLKK